MNIQAWKVKRVTTTRIFLLQCSILGMEYSVTLLTLWLYLNTLVKTEYVEFFYSVISASYLLAALLFSVMIGRWVDKTRKIRRTILICNTIVIIGNSLYILHYSPWLLVAGRLLCGAGSPLRSVISGEVARCYPADEVLSRFSANGMAFAFGFILGPGLNFLFKNVEFTIGSLHVTYANIPGIYMNVLFIGAQILIFLFLHDLSKEFDLKTHGELAAEIEDRSVPEILEPSRPTKSSSINTPRRSSILSLGEQLLQNEDASSKDRSSTFSYNPNRSPMRSNIPICGVLLDLPTNSFTRSLTASSHKQDEQRTKQSVSESSSKSGSIRSIRLKNSIAIAKLEQSGLFTQTFTRSDSMASASMLILARSFANDPEATVPDNYDNNGSTMSIRQIICQDLRHFDTLFVLASTYFVWFWLVLFDMWLPIMVIDVLGMGITELNGIIFGFGCISVVVLFFLSFQGFSDQSMFVLSLFCMLSLALMEVIFATSEMLRGNFYASIALWVLWGALFAIVVVMDEVFLIGVLTKMTSSKVQTVNESLRLSMARSGAITALLTSVYLFRWLRYVCLIGICHTVVAIFILLMRRKTLSAPKVVIK